MNAQAENTSQANPARVASGSRSNSGGASQGLGIIHSNPIPASSQ